MTAESPAQTSRSIIPGILAILALCLALGAWGLYAVYGQSRTLAVDSQPPGASVFVNGQLAGKTPLRINGLFGGNYSLRIEKDNYAPLAFPLTLNLGTTQITETLPPRGTGSLRIDIAPEGAEVLLDGELAGHTPLELSGVPTGAHDLTIRKTNYKPFTQRINLQPNETLPFRGIVLEDIVLNMLQSAIDKDPQRVSNYMDMGHYLFVNNKIRESADFYVRGMKVASKPLVFPKEMTPEERFLEQRLRNEDHQRINDDVRKKQGHNGLNVPKRDMELFIKLVNETQLEIIGENAGDWAWTQTQVENFMKDNKFEEVEKLCLKHIEAAKGMGTVAQAYISLITVRLRMKHVAEAVQGINDLIATPYGRDAAVLRQAANTIYNNAGGFKDAERAQLLSNAEVLLRRALAASPKRSEMGALCKFELAYVLFQQERTEESVPLYRDSVVETQEQSTKELRSQRLVDALRKLTKNAEAKEILQLLAKSPRDYIRRNAEEQLKTMGN